MQQAIDRLKQALDDMRQAQQSAQQNPQSASAQADARRAAERLAESERMMNGMRQQQAGSQLDDLSERADKLAQQQGDFAKRLEQAMGGDPRSGNQGRPAPGGGTPQQARQLADEKDKMAAELDRLQKDMQQAARDLAGTQPAAAGRVRDGLSSMQQTEVTNRTKASADRIRQGMGSFMVPTEKAVTQALDQVSKDLHAAQGALSASAAQGGQKGEAEQELARLERLRSQLQQMAGQGQQGGNQQGGNQQGGNQLGGNQQGGNQQGGNQQGNGSQQGGNQAGQFNSARGRNGGFGGFGRFQPEGLYDVPDVQYLDPGSVARDAQLQLNDLKDQFRDNPDALRELSDLNRDVQKMQMGATASPELDQRISREILPKLEALEVRLRRQIDEQETGQVRSGGSDRVAPGYTDAVAEYFRKLSKGR
jgi:hypothetical protein